MYTYHRHTTTRLDKNSSGSSHICKSPVKMSEEHDLEIFHGFSKSPPEEYSDNHQVCQAGHTRYGSCHHARAQIARQSCGDAAEMRY